MAFVAQYDGKIIDATKMTEEEIDDLQASHAPITLLECGHDAYIRKGPGNPHFYHAYGVQCDIPERRGIHQEMVQEVIVKEARKLGWRAETNVLVSNKEGLFADVLCSRGDIRVAFNILWNDMHPTRLASISDGFYERGIELIWVTQGEKGEESPVDMFQDLEIDLEREEVWVEGYPLDIMVEDQLRLAVNEPLEETPMEEPEIPPVDVDYDEDGTLLGNPFFTVEDYKEWKDREKALLERAERPIIVNEEKIVKYGKIPPSDYFLLYKKSCSRCNRPMLIWGLEPEFERLHWKDNLRSVKLRNFVADAVAEFVEDEHGAPEVAGVGWKTIGPRDEYQWSFVCPNWSCNQGQVSSTLVNQSKRYAVIPTPPMLDMDKRQY